MYHGVVVCAVCGEAGELDVEDVGLVLAGAPLADPSSATPTLAVAGRSGAAMAAASLLLTELTQGIVTTPLPPAPPALRDPSVPHAPKRVISLSPAETRVRCTLKARSYETASSAAEIVLRVESRGLALVFLGIKLWILID